MICRFYTLCDIALFRIYKKSSRCELLFDSHFIRTRYHLAQMFRISFVICITRLPARLPTQNFRRKTSDAASDLFPPPKLRYDLRYVSTAFIRLNVARNRLLGSDSRIQLSFYDQRSRRL